MMKLWENLPGYNTTMSCLAVFLLSVRNKLLQCSEVGVESILSDMKMCSVLQETSGFGMFRAPLVVIKSLNDKFHGVYSRSGFLGF